MKNINQEELNKILKEHELWLKGEGGKRADLSDTDLSDTDLSGVNLSDANLNNTNLRCANLKYADLSSANLRYADLKGANLRCADLKDADLRRANLEDADLSYSNLSNSNLRDVNLNSADLSSADLKDIKTNIHTIGYNLACPEKGSFIGYKKAKGCLIELLILEDAKRSSATTAKCRCNKAKVLDIRDIKTGKKVKEIRSNYDSNFIYKVGEIVHVDNFDNNRWNECATGIHFFINKENAINY
ncbi:MAG: pentapeptide repeat-containing protein [Clostridia bacterium]